MDSAGMPTTPRIYLLLKALFFLYDPREIPQSTVAPLSCSLYGLFCLILQGCQAYPPSCWCRIRAVKSLPVPFPLSFVRFLLLPLSILKERVPFFLLRVCFPFHLFPFSPESFLASFMTLPFSIPISNWVLSVLGNLPVPFPWFPPWRPHHPSLPGCSAMPKGRDFFLFSKSLALHYD